MPPRLILLLSLLVLAAPGRAQQEAEIVLGMSAAFTGASRGLGIEFYRGATAYFEAVNETGGIGGRRVVLRAYDDAYDPTRAVRNTIALVREDSVFALFGYVGTPTVTRVLPLLHHFGDFVLFFPFTGAQPQREAPYDRFVVNLRASYRQETQALVDHFARAGRRRVAVFYQADAYGRSGWDGVRRALAAHGLALAGEATYRRGAGFDAGFREQVEILRGAGADAVVSVGSYEACAAFIRDARDAGWEVPVANLSFVGGDALLRLLLAHGADTGGDYTRHLVNAQVVPSPTDTTLPAVREYRASMDRLGRRLPPGAEDGYVPEPYGFVSLEGYLSARVLVAVLRRMAAGARRDALPAAVDGLGELDAGIGVPVRFGPTRHQGLDAVFLTTIRDGRFVPLSPPPTLPDAP